jgi:hypothetical protein
MKSIVISPARMTNKEILEAANNLLRIAAERLDFNGLYHTLTISYSTAHRDENYFWVWCHEKEFKHRTFVKMGSFEDYSEYERQLRIIHQKFDGNA